MPDQPAIPDYEPGVLELTIADILFQMILEEADKKQTALQETESTEYLIAQMNTDIDLTQLPGLVI